MPYPRPGRIICAAGASILLIALVPTAPAAANTAHSRRSAETASATPSSGGGSIGTAPRRHKRLRLKQSAQVSDSGHQYPGDSQHLGDRILRQGMSGHDVRVLQDYLTRAGFATPVVGQFGPLTRRNVSAFERSNHLSPNGVVTWAVAQALRAAAGATPGTRVQNTAATAPAPTGKAQISNGLAVAPADAPAAVKAVIAAGNKIAFMPYHYGGGHASFNDSGYDCSGSVSFALHGGGLLASPDDSTGLESYGDPGRGEWITIWSNPGHTYMYVAGLRFDTAAQGSSGGSRWSTAGRSSSGYVDRHPSGL